MNLENIMKKSAKGLSAALIAGPLLAGCNATTQDYSSGASAPVTQATYADSRTSANPELARTYLASNPMQRGDYFKVKGTVGSCGLQMGTSQNEVGGTAFMDVSFKQFADHLDQIRADSLNNGGRAFMNYANQVYEQMPYGMKPLLTNFDGSGCSAQFTDRRDLINFAYDLALIDLIGELNDPTRAQSYVSRLSGGMRSSEDHALARVIGNNRLETTSGLMLQETEDYSEFTNILDTITLAMTGVRPFGATVDLVRSVATDGTFGEWDDDGYGQGVGILTNEFARNKNIGVIDMYNGYKGLMTGDINYTKTVPESVRYQQHMNGGLN